MGSKKKKDRQFQERRDTITIAELINDYLKSDSCPYDCRLTHRDLKAFQSPYLICLSNEFAKKNPELVLTERILLVRDCKGNIATYVNPKDLRFLGALPEIMEMKTNLNKLTLSLEDLAEGYLVSMQLNIQYNKVQNTLTILDEAGREDIREEIEGECHDKRKRKVKYPKS